MKAITPETKLAYRLSLIIAAILAILPFHAFLTTWAGSNTGHLDLLRIWKELIIVLILAPGALCLALKDRQLRKYFFSSKIVWAFAAYKVLHLALGFWALARHQVNTTAFIYALIINLRFIAFFLVCMIVAAKSDLLLRNWRKILLLPASFVIVFGLVQRCFLPYDFLKHFGYGTTTIPAYQTVDSDLNYQRIQSTTRGANPLGAYLALIIPAALICIERWQKYAYLGLGLLAIFYSYSRSAWLGLFFALVMFAGLKSRGRGVYKMAAALGAVFIIIGLGIYTLRSNPTAQDTFFHTSSNSTKISSNQQRASALKEGFKDVIHHPIGSGPGTAGPASFRNSGHTARIAENYYLQIAQEVGVLGLGIFVFINILVARQLWQTRNNQLSLLLLVTFAGISLINLVSHAWADDTLSLLWWGLAGIALAPILTDRRTNGKKAKTT